MLVVNNILLCVCVSFVVFVGTIWPLIAELFFDRKLSVGPPFFNLAFTPFMVALGLILPVGAMLPWKRAKLGRVLKTLRWPFLLALAIGALAWAMQSGRSALGPVGLFLAAWLISGSAVDLWGRTGRGADRLRRLRRLPRADWGKAVAHAGLGVTIAGVAAMMAWEVEDIRVVQVGEVSISPVSPSRSTASRGSGAEFPLDHRGHHPVPRRRRDRHHAPRKTDLSRGRDAHDRGRAQ